MRTYKPAVSPEPAMRHAAVHSPGGNIPHFDRIQRAFGRYDLRGVPARHDPPAADGLGAEAFTYGESVVYGQFPDLHTAAHEAAHVVQQRLGAAPASDESADGRALERHADAVADRVVARQSAVALLDRTPVPQSATGAPVVQRARKRKLNPKQEAQRQRLLERRERRASEEVRLNSAEREFRTAINRDPNSDRPPRPNRPLDYHPIHAFPLDYDQQPDRPKTQSVDDFLDRLPKELRNSNVRQIAEGSDPAKGDAQKRTELQRGGMTEVLAAHQFAQERGIDAATIKPYSASIDFEARDREGRGVLFDPFISPQGGPYREPAKQTKEDWAKNEGEASYYKHTHGKGGDKRTIGVWDQTYSSPEQVSGLRRELAKTGADEGAKVHELRVPLARMYAREHLAAERQIAGGQSHFQTVEQRYHKAQRRKPKERRVPFQQALAEQRQSGEGYSHRATFWRGELAKHPYFKKQYGE